MCLLISQFSLIALVTLAMVTFGSQNVTMHVSMLLLAKLVHLKQVMAASDTVAFALYLTFMPLVELK